MLHCRVVMDDTMAGPSVAASGVEQTTRAESLEHLRFNYRATME